MSDLAKTFADRTIYEPDSEEHFVLMGALEKLDDDEIQLLLDGMAKGRSAATVSPEALNVIRAAHDAGTIPTASTVAETMGATPASVRSALSALSRAGDVVTFKGLKLNNELMIWPQGTTEEDAKAKREEIKNDPASWKPDMRAILQAVYEIRQEGDQAVTIEKIAEHTGIKITSVASNISVLNTRGYVTSTDAKVGGKKVIFPVHEDVDVEEETAEILAAQEEAKAQRKAAQKAAELETSSDDDF